METGIEIPFVFFEICSSISWLCIALVAEMHFSFTNKLLVLENY